MWFAGLHIWRQNAQFTTVAEGVGQWHPIPMTIARPLLKTALVIFVTLVPATAEASDVRKLPAKVAKRCGTPVDWVKVSGKDSVQVQPSPDADFSKLECVLRELRPKGGPEISFVGNEAYVDRTLDPPWSFIAGGKIAELNALAIEVKKAGWVVGTLARAEDGTGFLTFQTPTGMTTSQGRLFADRLWKHEFGDFAIARAPSREGFSLEGE